MKICLFEKFRYDRMAAARTPKYKLNFETAASHRTAPNGYQYAKFPFTVLFLIELALTS